MRQKKSPLVDLNHRPKDYESSALTTELKGDCLSNLTQILTRCKLLESICKIDMRKNISIIA